MKIASSGIAFQSTHSSLELNQTQENLQFWIGENPDAEADGPFAATVSISKKGLELQRSLYNSGTNALDGETENVLSDAEEQKLTLLEILLENLTGKKIRFRTLRKIKYNDGAPGIQPLQVNPPARAGWGLSLDSVTTRYESEKTTFSSTGTVLTSDGKEIRIDLQLSMSRELMSREEIHIRAGDAVKKDPLVVNFNAPSASLRDTKFSFDVDCDGIADQISGLTSGSGFLALDLNKDGRINNGSELFGPQSGNGFSDLAGYDSDNNGWIDENDGIFDKLRIWTRDEAGNDVLFALGEKGIGAIYLGSAGTDFSLRDQANRENGVIRRTGIFLKENGAAGTIQHVDLVV